MAISQRDLHQQLRAESLATRHRLADVVRPLDGSQLNEHSLAPSLDWRAVRLGSPALPSWAPKMNLGDVFKIHVVHVSRHARQIERLILKL